MYKIAWYARDGYLDLYPVIAEKLKELRPGIISHYVCHHALEEEKLRSAWNVDKPAVLADYLKKNWKRFEFSVEKIRALEAKYNEIPLIRCLWADMFEMNLSEDFMAENLIGHLEFWESFLLENKIDMLITEQPSMLSTCIAWLVCKKHDIKFCAFNSTPLDYREVISNSWYGHYEGLEEKINNAEIVKDSDTYRKVVKYLEKMKTNPRKVESAIIYSVLMKKRPKVLRSKIINGVFNITNVLRRDKLRTQYYIKPSLVKSFFKWLGTRINSWFLKMPNVFDRNVYLEKESYFLLPLHQHGEWSIYSFLGPGYADQLAFVKHVLSCLPIGRKLYVKAHMARFDHRPASFYRAIKSFHNVRLIGPNEDTFKLIRHSEGIITYGSTVGFEAMMMNKPVIIFGEPWYRNLPGVYRSDKPEILAELLQKAHRLRVPTEEEKTRIIYALFDISFEGVGASHEKTFNPENIFQLANAIHNRIDKLQYQKEKSLV